MVKPSLKALQSQLTTLTHRLSVLEERVKTHIYYADITAGTVRDHHAKLDKLDKYYAAEVKRLSDCLACINVRKPPVRLKHGTKKS